MKKTIVFSITFVLLVLASFAQEKPGWIYTKPKPENNTYLYVVEAATGATELEARNQTFARVLQSTAMRLGQPINSEDINKAVQSGKSFEVISSQYNIPINKVCEYTEKIPNGYRVFVLCQVANAGNTYADFDYGFSGCYDTKGYKDRSALFMSALIPGSGQFIKRHYGEGVITFLAEAAFATGVIFHYDYIKRCQLEITIQHIDPDHHSQSYYYYLNDQIEKMQMMNYVCVGSALALYVFNLYRAYSVKPKYKNSLAFSPTVVPVGSDMAYGFGFSYSF